MDLVKSQPLQPSAIDDLADRTLPAWIYCDPEFLELEREQLFLRSWQLVCHVSDIPTPGSYHTFALLGESAVVVRDEDGSVRAFHNVCRHRAARLLDGDAGHCERRIVCPYHAWTYELNGALVGVPFKSQYPQLKEGDYGLTPIESDIFMGFVFIRFVAGGPTLAEMMAPMVQEMAHYRIDTLQPLGKVIARPSRTNWKNACDNYIDALHVKVAHRGLDSLLGPSYGMKVCTDTVHRLVGEVDEMARSSLTARAYARVLPEIDYLPADYRRRWLYFLVWPNLTFNLYPDQVEFLQFLPVSPTQSLIRDAAYATVDAGRELRVARRLNLRINRRVGVEDNDLIERVQVGLASSSFETGILGRNEVCLRAYAAKMRETLPVSRLEKPPPRGTVAQTNQRLSG
jgi:carnitine monooxygenase subunit